MEPNLAFILGVPRSGTTLLRVLLDSHAEIAAPTETPWITGAYSDVSLRELTESLINHPFGPVANLPGVDPDHVYSAARSYLHAILTPYLEHRSRRIVVLKTPDDIEHAGFLMRAFPDARFILLSRDGRDVACSTVAMRGSAFGYELRDFGQLNVVNALRRWVAWETALRTAVARLPDPASIAIRYEDLVTNPTHQLETISAFLGIEFDPKMLDYATAAHEMPTWELGAADVRERDRIAASSVGRWKRELDPWMMRLIDIEFGDDLIRLGYSRCSDEIAVPEARFPLLRHRAATSVAAVRHFGRAVVARARRAAHRARRAARPRGPSRAA